MITLKRLNVVRQVVTEEKAAKLEKQGFTRMGGETEGTVTMTVTEVDLAKPGETMYERLNQNLQKAVVKAAAPAKGKIAKDGDKEDQNGNGTDQPDSGDGAK